jgi:nitrogen regulatory protein PII
VSGVGFITVTHTIKSNIMETKYDLIIAIIDAEQHDIVIEACRKSGAPVYTAFTVQGSVGKKSFKLLTVEVETPKEIIMVLTPQSKTEKVKKQIIQDADLDNPNNGIVLVLDVKDLGGYSSLLSSLNVE